MANNYLALLKAVITVVREFNTEERKAAREAAKAALKPENPPRIERLRGLGVDVDWISSPVPVSAEGTVDGEPFHFRARGASWKLMIGPKDLWFTDGAWTYGRDYGVWPEAGWMEEHEALEFIEEGVRAWLAEQYQAAREW